MDSNNENWSGENQNGEFSSKLQTNLVKECFGKFVLHPWEYARFLAQIGHEPLVPKYSRNIIGVKHLFFPNLMTYAKHIYSVNGLKGMYVGLCPKIVGICVRHFASELVSGIIKIDENQNLDDEDSEIQMWTTFAINTSKEMLSTASNIILTHPFHVVSMRMMAQFIGCEQKYTDVFQSLCLINSEEGVTGLFAGIIPRLLSDLSIVIVVNMIKLIFSRYLFNLQPINLSFVDAALSYGIYYATYPFNVVTACTAISNCGLAAGMPPDMPVFGNWLECMKYLYRCGQLSRGEATWYRSAPLSKFLKPL